MTEEEAKTKWCPFVRYRSINGEGINRWALDDCQMNPEPSRCIASACMAWRWLVADQTQALKEAMAQHERHCSPGTFQGRPERMLREIVLGNAQAARERGDAKALGGYPAVDFDRIEGFCGVAGHWS